MQVVQVVKFLLERFRVNRNTIGCHSQTQKFERYASVINCQGEGVVHSCNILVLCI